jgi:hypothetical protein
MFRALIAVCRFPGILYARVKGIDHQRMALVLLDAFGSAAAASLYCAPYDPDPEDLEEMESEEAGDEASDNGAIRPRHPSMPE